MTELEDLRVALVGLDDGELRALCRASMLQAHRSHDADRPHMVDVWQAMSVLAGRLLADREQLLRDATDAAEHVPAELEDLAGEQARQAVDEIEDAERDEDA